MLPGEDAGLVLPLSYMCTLNVLFHETPIFDEPTWNQFAIIVGVEVHLLGRAIKTTYFEMFFVPSPHCKRFSTSKMPMNWAACFNRPSERHTKCETCRPSKPAAVVDLNDLAAARIWSMVTASHFTTIPAT